MKITDEMVEAMRRELETFKPDDQLRAALTAALAVQTQQGVGPSPFVHVEASDLTKRLRSMRSCTVCEGDGIKSNGKQCGGCDGVGEVPRYDRTGVEAANEIDRGSAALKALMAKLADLLDEDHFAACEDIVRKAGIEPPVPASEDKLQTAIYRLCCIEDSPSMSRAEKALIREWIDDLRTPSTAEMDAHRSALVDVPAVESEPVAWLGRDKLYRDRLFSDRQIAQSWLEDSDGVERRLVPLYASRLREGEDSAEVEVLSVARAIAKVEGFALPNDMSLPFSDGSRIGQVMAKARAALAATRSGSATNSKGCAE